jgi:hypothetical protein
MGMYDGMMRFYEAQKRRPPRPPDPRMEAVADQAFEVLERLLASGAVEFGGTVALRNGAGGALVVRRGGKHIGNEGQRHEDDESARSDQLDGVHLGCPGMAGEDPRP